ncbi:MAG: DNA circularization N-terminal domain-containing protein [Pseudomonadota bacterium]
MNLHAASWGDLALDVLTVHDSANQRVVSYEYPRRDGADSEDMGSEARTTEAQLIFFSRAGMDDPYDRFAAFAAQVKAREPYVFTHPLTGSYDARVGPFRFWTATDAKDTIYAECTFIEYSTSVAIYEAGAGAPKLAGVEEVRGLAAIVNTIAASLGMVTDLADDAVSTVEGWADNAALTVRDVEMELTALSNRISTATDSLDAFSDPKRWPLVQSIQKLHYSCRRASETFRDRSYQTCEIPVTTPLPLLVIASKTYGADEASARYEQLLELNDIRNPSRIEAGTVLRGYAPVEPRRRLRLPG